jgi:hypothetical protein
VECGFACEVAVSMRDKQATPSAGRNPHDSNTRPVRYR